MRAVAILGADELGATLARRLAECGLFGRVVLVDPDEGKAKGKALDIMQSGPVEGYDTRVSGTGSLQGVGAEAFVVTDAPEGVAGDPGLAPPDSYLKPIVAAAGGSVLLTARPEGASLVAAAVRAGMARGRVLGSAPLATASALRRVLADELGGTARDVSLTVLGLPPASLVLPQGAATLGGIPIARLAPAAERRAVGAVKARPPGPAALAAAAEGVLRALFGLGESVRPAFVTLDGEFGHRRVALAVPARLGRGQVLGVVETGLEPVDRTALDSIAARAVAAFA
jgi:malate dehydrogenase